MAQRERGGLLLLLALLALAWTAPVARAAGRAVDLQLVLAVDASGSVDARRFELQRRGYAEAFANPRVLQAIRSGALRAIAVTMFQWTGPSLQARIIDWTLIEDEASADAVAAAIAGTPRKLFGGGTSISGAIDYASRLVAASDFAGERRVIDVSGDGANNVGRPASVARDAAVADGIVINGLPILALEPDLDAYYRDNVIGGPGAFVVAIDTFEQFGDAILNKLISEIAAAPARWTAQAAARQGDGDDEPRANSAASRRGQCRGDATSATEPALANRKSVYLQNITKNFAILSCQE
jgi:hypothetical protein